MGIPKLYSILSRKWPEICTDAESMTECDALFVDLNSILYNCIAMASSRDEVFTNVKCYITTLTARTKPKKLLYVAIDGVPPLGKLKQQYIRRRRSSTNRSDVDNNELTPGTEFMLRLSKELLRYFSEQLIHDFVQLEIVLSDSNVPGEGEYKIMRYIQDELAGSAEKYVIYSNDADLIVLTLLTRSYICIIKENLSTSLRPFNQKSFQHFDVSKLKKLLLSRLSLQDGDRPAISFGDVALSWLMLGNDFLPTPVKWEVDHETVDFLLDILRDMYSENNNRTIVSWDGSIDWKNFDVFLKKARDWEFTAYKRGNSVKQQSVHNSVAKLDLQGLSMREKKQKISDHVDKIQKHNFRAFRSRLYGNAGNGSRLDLENIAGDYLKGLQWVSYYYHGSLLSWRWIYNYQFAPMMSDLISIVHEQVNFTADEPITPFQQLALVLPRASKNLLPAMYTSGDEYAALSSLMQQLPISPQRLDYLRLLTANSLNNQFDPSVIHRNHTGTDRVFNTDR